MFTELPRYMGFPSQIWVKKRFAFDSFVRMFNGKRPMMVSTYQFKDRTTPIVDSLVFDIDSYFGLRIPYKNTKSLINFCRENNLKYIANFSVSGDTPLFVKIEDRQLFHQYNLQGNRKTLLYNIRTYYFFFSF